jgi:hypothetical protein
MKREVCGTWAVAGKSISRNFIGKNPENEIF